MRIKTLSNGCNYSVQPEHNKVKRPLNPFMVWSKKMRRKIHHENPKMHHSEISKHLGKQWKGFSDEERRPYVEESMRLRQTHRKKYPNYKYTTKRLQKQRDLPTIGMGTRIRPGYGSFFQRPNSLPQLATPTVAASRPFWNGQSYTVQRPDGYVNRSYGVLSPSPNVYSFGDAPIGESLNATTYCNTRPGYPSSQWLYTSNSCGYVNRSYGVLSPSPNVYSFGDTPIGESLNATTYCTTRPGYPISQWLYTSNSCGMPLQTRAPHDYPTSISLQHSPILSYGGAPTYAVPNGSTLTPPMTGYPLSYSSGPLEPSDSANSYTESEDSFASAGFEAENDLSSTLTPPTTSYPLSYMYSSGPSEPSDSPGQTNSPVDSVDSYTESEDTSTDSGAESDLSSTLTTLMTNYPLSYSSGPTEPSDSPGQNNSPVDSVASYTEPEDNFASADSGAENDLSSMM